MAVLYGKSSMPSNYVYPMSERGVIIIQVVEGEIKQYDLPKVGSLLDGSTI